MNLPQLDNLIHYVPYHFSHSINDYSYILYFHYIYYKLLSMFMIHVSFIHISSSLFTCVMDAFSKEVDTGNDCMYPRVPSQYATVISICTILYDPNGVAVMTQRGQLYLYAAATVSLIGMPIYPFT